MMTNTITVGAPAISYAWDNGVTNGVPFTPTASGDYIVIASDGLGCTATDTVSVSVPDVLSLGDTLSFCNGDSILLDAGSGYNYYSWSTGDTSQTIYASNSGTYSATVGNSTPVVNDYSMSFDGTDDYVEINNPNIIDNADKLTINFWLKTSNLNQKVFMGKWSDPGTSVNRPFIVELDAGNSRIQFIVNGGAGFISMNSSIINLNQWNFISCVYDGVNNMMYLYHDGQLINQNPVSSGGQLMMGANNINIGSHNNLYDYYDGSFDNIHIWNSALTQQEIEQYMNCPPTGNETGLVGYWNFEEGSGNTILDLTSNGNDGTINGATHSADTPEQVCVSCTASDTVYVQEVALPTVNAGIDLSICEGDTVTLSGSGATNYSWDNGVSDGIAFTPISTSTYTLLGADTNGCENSDQVLVTLNTLPTVNGGLDVSLCFGDTTVLNGSGALTYTWDNSVSDGVSFTPTSTATYTVTGTDGNGCENSDQVEVNVNALPTVIAGSDVSICVGDSAILNGSGAASYTWDNGITDGVHFIPGASDTYTLTGTDVNGCENTDQVAITLNALPTVDAGIFQQICDGDTVTLSGAGATTYIWDNGILDGVLFTPSTTTLYTVTGTDANGCSASDTVSTSVWNLPLVDAGADQSVCDGDQATLSGSGASSYVWSNSVSDGVAFTPPSTATYLVTGTDVNGCVNVDQVVVTVNALPTVSAGADVAVCAGDSAILNGSGAVNYTWDNGITDGVHFIPVTANTYTVTGTDGNGCENTDQVVITINALPTVGAGADQTVCEGNPVTVSGTGASSYTWDNGVSDGVAFMAAATATYTVTGSDVNGCENTDDVLVTVTPSPTVVALAAADTACVNWENVTLSGSPVGGVFSGNGVTDDRFYPSIAGVGSHDVLYSYTDPTTGCVGTDSLTMVVEECTGISENGRNNLSIYPNPTSDQITLDIKGYSGVINVHVYDLQGRLLETTNSTKVSLKKHAKGIYVLKVSYGEVIEEVRVVRD
jgi:hypothetical protein